jgi:squalene-hopene/tetraprenyl-beta-curcumene cyclase
MVARVPVLVTAACAMLALAIAPCRAANPDDEHKAKAQAMITKAITYLRSKQDPSGGWGIPPAEAQRPVFPAITALALSGMLMEPGVDARDESVAKGAAFILKYRQPDGGIYDRVLPSYNTAISLSALARIDTPEAKAALKPAQDFLRKLQFSEAADPGVGASEAPKPVAKSDPFYGGIGYGRHGRPDLSNLGFMLAGLHDSGVSPDDPAFQRALVFLSRVQMNDATNDMPYADGSSQGGFIYATSINKDSLGTGQSFAGEVAESLTGGAGTVTIVKIGNDKDAKPKLLPRTPLEAALREAVAKANPTAAAMLPAGHFALLGPTADGESSNEFTIYLPLPLDQATQVLHAAVGDSLGEGGRFDSRPVTASVPMSRLRSYGSMSYVGFKSLIYAGLKADDPRVQAVERWISQNYTLEENPGVGTDGYYYFLLAFGRAMDARGQATINVLRPNTGEDASAPVRGQPSETRNWANDLIDALAKHQQPDGSFKPVDDRWMESDPVLITAYSLIALQHAAR